MARGRRWIPGWVLGAALAGLGFGDEAGATVMVTNPNNGAPFFSLFRPTGKFDETGLSGFELLISSRTGEFRAADQYLISGEETEPTTSLADDRGGVGDLSGTPFGFSIQHNLEGGRNFTYRVTNQSTGQTTVQCWGLNCPAGSNATELLNGIPPIDDYNGIQIQARAQDVEDSSTTLQILSLTGVDVEGAAFFDETVTPDSPGTIVFGDFGRRGQWMLADDNDLVLNEWELTGLVTLFRPDDALVDLSKVRLAVDLVREPSLPFVPEPSTALLLASGLAGLAARGARRQPR